MSQLTATEIKHQITQSTVLSKVTAAVVVALLVVFFLTTIGNITTIFNKVEMVKVDQYPVSVAAGHLETRLVQLRTMASQAMYVSSSDAADDMLRVNEETTDEIWDYINTIAASDSVEGPDARTLAHGYTTLNMRLERLAAMVRNPSINAANVSQYVNDSIYPLISDMLTVDLKVLDQSTHAVDTVYDAVNTACRQTAVVSWVLIVAVLLSLFVFMALLYRKAQREEHLAADLRQALELAQSASRAKSTFLSSMSHDIRTPMNAIVGLTTIARANMDDPDRVVSCLDRITTSSNHLLSLVNDVLDMSEIENGHISLNEDDIDLPTLMDELITIMQTQARNKRLDLSVSVGPLAHPHVHGDALRLQQVVLNLASNAIKYTEPEGRVSITLTERPTTATPNVNDYLIEVEDNGIGMEPEFLENIFTPFERERNETTHATEGAGLGMAITKNVVDLIGGTIEVESTPGEGSRFLVILPLEAATADPASQATSASTAPDSPDAPVSGRVLLVEDDAINREIAIELIQSLGADVDTACDGVEAIEALQRAPQGHYDLIFMDFQMPRMGGVEAATKIIERERAEGRPHTPIVAMTANAFNEDRNKAMKAGMDGFMSKPISVDQLKKNLRRYLPTAATDAPKRQSNEATATKNEAKATERTTE